jgi:RNA-directed DNA polymerase
MPGAQEGKGQETSGTGDRRSPTLQDLRRRIYGKAKAEPSQRFWGLYVHVCKRETLCEAYRLAKANNGAPGIDGVTFAEIEERGVESFLEQIRDELVTHQYRPMRLREKAIPKGGGKGVRVLKIPTVRDRVVQGAVKLILEPIFEADFESGSYGYRPNRSAHEAQQRVARAIAHRKTQVLDLDLRAYFDNIRHHILLEKLARRVEDREILHLIKLMLKTSGKKGVPQGGVISPLLSNLYLNGIDQMLAGIRETTRTGEYTRVEYARYADDLVVLVNAPNRRAELVTLVERRIREGFAELEVQINEDKSRIVNLANGESFDFLGFTFRRVRSLRGVWRPWSTPSQKSRKALLGKLREIFRHTRSQPIRSVVDRVNPILRGWVSYYAVANSSRCFSFVRTWVEKKMRRQMTRARKRKGFGWSQWSSKWIYARLGLFNEYRLRRIRKRCESWPR